MALHSAAPHAAAPDASPGRRRWWLAAILGAVVLGFVVSSWHRYVTLERELTETALARHAAVGALAASTLAVKFERLVDVGVALATRVRFQELVAAGRWSEAAQILQRVPQDFDFLDRLFLADPRGTLRADVPQAAQVRGRNFAHRDWYKGVSRDWQPYVSPLYRRSAAPQRNVIAVAIPIRGPGDGVAGILVLQVKLEAYFDWARRIDLASRVLIVDAGWRSAFDSRAPAGAQLAAGAAEPLVQRLAPGASPAQVVHDAPGGRDLVFGYAPAAHGWSVVTLQDGAAAFAARDTLLRQMLLDGALIALFAVAAIVLATTVVVQRRREAVDRAQRAELESRVQARTAQLEAANQELAAFSYSVSHDLRAPLRAIDGYARMLQEDFAERLGEEGARQLGVVRDEARRMGQLIDDLLAFSRAGRQALRAARIDMAELARDVACELAPEFPQAEVQVGELPPAAADPALLRQVWLNLIGNALKYSARHPAPRVEIGGRADGAQAEYWVQDNGAGFDERYAHKLFGVFQRLHGAHEFPGTGVGLAIVQRVVARHGGRVWAAGKPGAGARFSFALPASRSDP